MSALSVASQGILGGALSIATQGFAGDLAAVPIAYSPEIGGSLLNVSVYGYTYSDHVYASLDERSAIEAALANDEIGGALSEQETAGSIAATSTEATVARTSIDGALRHSRINGGLN